MKKIALLVLCSAALARCAYAQLHAQQHFGGVPDTAFDTIAPDPAAEQRIEALNRDPWRIIDGTTNRVDIRWSMFGGQVLGVQSGGIRVDGWYWDANGHAVPGEFFVANFPYQMADNETIPANCFFAWPAGNYEYTTVLGGSRTLHKLDYGIVWHPDPPKPLTPEEIAAQNAKIDAEKNAAAAKALKYNQDAAAKGDAYGLMRMGERYRDGDGVPKDPLMAKDYLTRAAAAGSPTAEDDLKQLAAK